VNKNQIKKMFGLDVIESDIRTRGELDGIPCTIRTVTGTLDPAGQVSWCSSSYGDKRATVTLWFPSRAWVKKTRAVHRRAGGWDADFVFREELTCPLEVVRLRHPVAYGKVYADAVRTHR
jgi:hypothetical protein